MDSAAVLRLTNEKIIPLIRDSRLRIKERKRELLEVTNSVHAAGVAAIVESFADNEDYSYLRDELMIRVRKLGTVSKPGYGNLGKPFRYKEYDQTQSRRLCEALPLP